MIECYKAAPYVVCRRFFFRVTNARGVPLTVRILNADYPYDWPPNYSVRATYDREFWFQVCYAQTSLKFQDYRGKALLNPTACMLVFALMQLRITPGLTVPVFHSISRASMHSVAHRLSSGTSRSLHACVWYFFSYQALFC